MNKPTFDEAQVREAAYFLWLEEGMPEGRDEVHWLMAIEALAPVAKPVRKKAPAKPRATKATATKTTETKTTAAKKPAAKKATTTAKTTAAKKPAAKKAKAAPKTE